MAHGWVDFRIQHGKGTTTSGVFGTFSVCMCLKTVFEIIGDPCIESLVGALQDVDDPAQMIFFSLTGRCKIPQRCLDILLRH